MSTSAVCVKNSSANRPSRNASLPSGAWVTISRITEKPKPARREKKRRRGSVRRKIAATFLLFTAALLLILNIYPIIATRDMVFSTKQSSMTSQGLVISSSLSALDELTAESVSQVMQLLDVTPMTRIIITDASARVLFDTSEENDVGRYAAVSEIIAALDGNIVFYCDYSGGVFLSRAAVPVMSGSTLLGTVYLYEYDIEQGDIIRGLQNNIRNISVVFAVAGVLVIMIMSTTLSYRIKRLTTSMKIVYSGDYSHRTLVRGRDDIAEMSQQFNVLIGRLESTEEVRRRFVSDASHELRTPLSAIKLLSDSIIQSDNMDTETMREFASDIGSEAERLQRITEKLMALTKLDAGVSQTRTEEVDIRVIVMRALHLLEPLARRQHIAIKLDVTDGCIVMASPDDLYQIVFNLTENGIKYNLDGGEVRLSLHRVGPNAVLWVEDTGIGIPEADRENIFDRFYRVDKARSRASGGSGLGLSIVHEAVLANRGTIEVTSEERHGTRFTVTFPLVKKRGRGR